jgi:asparagine synthetase B (glutamine-hydrolysing)
LRPQIALARAIGDKQTVCLTGDGADEGFGGYGRAMRYDSQGSDLFHELPAWHLVRLDRVMMRHRIEVRSPFLARQVVQIALGLPYEERRNKKILRDLFRDDLPPEIADQPKKPLRIEEDREERSQNLVRLFRQKDATWHSLLQSGSPVALVVS